MREKAIEMLLRVAAPPDSGGNVRTQPQRYCHVTCSYTKSSPVSGFMMRDDCAIKSSPKG